MEFDKKLLRGKTIGLLTGVSMIVLGSSANALETLILYNEHTSDSQTYTVTFYARSDTPGDVGTSVGSTSRTVSAGGMWHLTASELQAGSGIISTNFQGYATITDGSAGIVRNTKLWGAVFFMGDGLIAGFPLSDIQP